MLAAIYFSEYVNRRNGGVLITPWTVGEMPDEWQDVYRAMQSQEAKVKQKNALEHKFRAFRQKHPTYRKYG